LRAYAGIDPLTNRQKYVTRTFHGGKREAEEALARLVVEVAAEAMPHKTQRSVTCSVSGWS
jgi:hypothetical protein